MKPFVCLFFKEEEKDGGGDKAREGERTPLRNMDINLNKKISINLIICLKKPFCIMHVSHYINL